MTLLVTGTGLRWWSFWALGRYLTFTVDVSPDQQVIAGGPYHVLRHPGYAGGLLAMIGIGVIYSNWVGLAGFALPCLGSSSGESASRKPRCSAPAASRTVCTQPTTNGSSPSSGETAPRARSDFRQVLYAPDRQQARSEAAASSSGKRRSPVARRGASPPGWRGYDTDTMGSGALSGRGTISRSVIRHG